MRHTSPQVLVHSSASLSRSLWEIPKGTISCRSPPELGKYLPKIIVSVAMASPTPEEEFLQLLPCFCQANIKYY